MPLEGDGMKMERLIDLSALGIGERNPNAFIDPERAYRWNDILKILEAAPTVDAVEVVRCRDCAVPHNKYTGCPKLNGLVTTPDFYCPFGKRKDDDGNG